MDKINVLIVSGSDFNSEFLDNIAAIDPRISLRIGVKQFIEELRKKNAIALADRFENDFSFCSDRQENNNEESLDDLLSQSEVIFGRMALPDNIIRRAPRLRWIHLQGAGLDAYNATGVFESDIMITYGKGTMATPIAEHVLAFIFALSKNFRRLLINKQIKKWDRFISNDIDRKTIGIIGLGAIGKQIAQLAKGVGMHVLAMKRTVSQEDKKKHNVDELFPPDRLDHLLSSSDYVVLSAPLTPETTGMIGERELRMMKSSAYFINIARGKMVDEAALIKALKEGWIAGAGLDVFNTEPLPPENELWELPNVIISCHQSAYTPSGRDKPNDLFCENLRRYVAGEQLLNVVTRP